LWRRPGPKLGCGAKEREKQYLSEISCYLDSCAYMNPWSKVLEKLIVVQLVKKFPTFSAT
jgi:hypothetical protein